MGLLYFLLSTSKVFKTNCMFSTKEHAKFMNGKKQELTCFMA